MYKISKFQKEDKRIHIIGTIIKIIIYIILIPIIIFNFTLIIKALINPNETPDFFGYKNFIIVSGSMEPTIMTGDAIFVKEVPEDQIHTNDIISFSQSGTIITHRIIEINTENGIKKYRTKGDNNNSQDRESITYNQIEGKYQFKISHFGTISEILKNKYTLIILILILIINFWYVTRLNKKRNRRKEKRIQYEEEKNK